jgi:hypothetical protein
MGGANPNAPVIFLVPTRAVNTCSGDGENGGMTQLSSMFGVDRSAFFVVQAVQRILGSGCRNRMFDFI